MRRRACSRTGSAASWSAGVMRRSRVPVHSAALVAYLATYPATLVSVSSPVVVIGPDVVFAAPGQGAGGQAGGGRGVEVDGSGGLVDGGGEQVDVAQAGGAVVGPAGPSRRMMAWKWTTPRRWYSATLA